MGGFLQNLFTPPQRRPNYVQQTPDPYAPTATPAVPAAPGVDHTDDEVNQLGDQLDTALQAKGPGRGTQVLEALLGPRLGPLVTGSGGRAEVLKNLTSRYSLAGQAAQRQRQSTTDTLQQQNIQSEIKARQDAEKQKESPVDKQIDEGFNQQQQKVLVFQKPDGSTYTKVVPEIVAPEKTTLQGSFEEQGYQDALKQNPSLTRTDYHTQYTAAGRAPKDETTGTWTFAEDKDGNPVQMNTKTGETRPAPGGAQPRGTKTKQDAELAKTVDPINAANTYADDYINHGVFTGPGDEALMEKFFDLAKPSTGFRMTKPQQDMLMNARSYLGSGKALVHHALTGSWFDDEQRKQIVQTMKDLAGAKLSTSSQTKGAGAPPAAAAPSSSGIKIIRDANGRITGVE